MGARTSCGEVGGVRRWKVKFHQCSGEFIEP